MTVRSRNFKFLAAAVTPNLDIKLAGEFGHDPKILVLETKVLPIKLFTYKLVECDGVSPPESLDNCSTGNPANPTV